MKRAVVGLMMLLGAAAGAQQSVPEIPFDSAPNALRLPLESYAARFPT